MMGVGGQASSRPLSELCTKALNYKVYEFPRTRGDEP